MKPESEKFSHAEVNYENVSTHAGDCDDCKHFIAGNPPACEGVKKPISPEGWCIRFDRLVSIHPNMPSEAQQMKHHSFSHTTIEHHKDGSHTIHHHHESDSSKDVKHAAADHDQMMDSMMDHTSAPNPGEAEADMGQHGVPPAIAASAGLQAPQGMGQ
jgi:hypothetical protein